jgi:hypothetical protein
MSAILSGKVRLSLQPLDLATLVQSAVDTAMPAAQAKQIGIQSVLDPRAAVLVSGDASRLQQVLWNLLSNAVKFTPKDGEILVTLDRVEDEVEVKIRDTGPGIAAEFLPYVFDRFRQADAATDAAARRPRPRTLHRQAARRAARGHRARHERRRRPGRDVRRPLARDLGGGRAGGPIEPRAAYGFRGRTRPRECGDRDRRRAASSWWTTTKTPGRW